MKIMRVALAALAVTGLAVTGNLAVSSAFAAARPAAARPAAARPVAARPAPAGRLPGAGFPALARADVRGSAAPVKSPDWAGWADTPATGTAFTSIAASFVIPAVNCADSNYKGATADGSDYTYWWAGLDGCENFALEQAGIGSQCTGPTAAPQYFAFYQMFPRQLVTENTAVTAGDHVTLLVQYTKAGRYLLKVTDATAKTGFTTYQKCTGDCQRASAEVITEAPGGGVADGFPLAAFSPVSFTGASVSATDGARTAHRFGLTTDPGFWTGNKMVMVTSHGRHLASVSGLKGHGRDFTVTFRASS